MSSFGTPSSSWGVWPSSLARQKGWYVGITLSACRTLREPCTALEGVSLLIKIQGEGSGRDPPKGGQGSPHEGRGGGVPRDPIIEVEKNLCKK